MEETNNNLEEAKVWLKKKGFKDAENRMTRTANTKLHGLKVKGNEVSVCELSCETDFVSGTDMFKNYLNILLDTLSENSSIQKIQESDLEKIKISENSHNSNFNNLTLLEGLKNIISKTQENCKIGICEKFIINNSENITIGSYLHTSPENNPNLGLKAAYVVLDANKPLEEKQKKKLNDLAYRLSMQVVALSPKYLNIADVPQDLIEQQSKILKDFIKADEKIKPEDYEKVLTNKINEWYEEIVLNEQTFVIVDHESGEAKMKVSKLLSKVGKNMGIDNLSIREFKLFA